MFADTRFGRGWAITVCMTVRPLGCNGHMVQSLERIVVYSCDVSWGCMFNSRGKHYF